MGTVVDMPRRPPTCPEHPDVEPEVGFGLAGGGFGSYTICPECHRILSKVYDNEGVRVRGVARDPENARAVTVYFTDALNDDDLRSLHDYLRGWRQKP